MPALASTFAANLKLRRKRMGMTQEALALASGYSESYISEVEKGHKSNPTLGFVETMAECLKLDATQLLSEKFA